MKRYSTQVIRNPSSPNTAVHSSLLTRFPAPVGLAKPLPAKHVGVNNQPALEMNSPGDRYEQEADQAASSILAGDTASAQSSAGSMIQRQDDHKPKSEQEKYQDAAKKVGEAFLETEPGKKIKDQATELGKSFLATLPGKIITGAAAVTAISVITAKNAPLPMQVPEIPLDSLAPGLSMKINYEGPVQKPTAASISFTYKLGGGEDKEKKPALSSSEKYRAETAKMDADMAKFQEGLKTPAEKKQDAALMDAFVRSKQGSLFGPPSIPGLKPRSETTLKMREDDAPVQRKKAPGAQPMGPTPAVVHAVLAQGGQPLDPATRAYMEPRFGQDFSHVRVHADARAADSAQSLNALAYTVGSHIVFGTGQYAPQSSEGKKLLAHEMVHVVQQTGASGVQTHSSTPADTHEGAADRAAANLVQGQAVQIPADANPPYLQRQQFQLAPPFQLQPQQQSNVHLSPNLQLRPHLLPEDLTQIDAFLTLHGFSSSEQFVPMFDGAPTTLDAVTDRVVPLVLPIIPRDDVKQYVTQRFIGLTVRDLPRYNIDLPPVQIPNIWAQAPAAPEAAPGHAPITFTTAVNMAWHVNLTSSPGSSGDATLQFQIGEDAPLQRVFQVSYNINTHQAQALVGGQATADLELVNNLLKLSGFVQVVAGVAWTGSPASGMSTVVQPSAGGQLTLTWHGVQFAVQAALSVTGTQGQPTTGEINVTPQVTIPLERQTPTVHRTPSSELTGRFEIRDWVERSGYSQLERLPTSEKVRLVTVLLGGDTIINFDADAIGQIWRAATGGERQQLRQIIEPRIPEAHTPEVQAQLRRLFSEQ